VRKFQLSFRSGPIEFVKLEFLSISVESPIVNELPQDPEAKVPMIGGLRKHHMSDADLRSVSATPESDFKPSRNSNFGNLHHHHHQHKHHGADHVDEQEVSSSANHGHPVKQNGFHLEFISEHVKGWFVWVWSQIFCDFYVYFSNVMFLTLCFHVLMCDAHFRMIQSAQSFKTIFL